MFSPLNNDNLKVQSKDSYSTGAMIVSLESGSPGSVA
jgi:hypothetical protein